MKNAIARSVAAAILSAAAFAPSAASAHASFEDHAVTVQYGLDLGLGAGFQALQTFVVSVSDAVEIPKISLNSAGTSSWRVDIFDSGLAFTYTGSIDFMNFGSPEFIGFRVFDAASVLEPIESASISNTAYVSGQSGNLIEGFEPSLHFSHDENSLWLNLNGSMYHHVAMPGMGDPLRNQIRVAVAFEHEVSPPPVPEPQTWALLLGGLGLTAFAARRAARRC
ncbi:MAG: PEP-CTERM sorting domain-containing protein [Pseudomonadota bacterium]